MSVEIDPVELGFHRPFTNEVSQVLKIKNPQQIPVAFKVKTTAPKQYCVRPNSGRIEPGQSVEVSVLLQAMRVEPPLDAKCKDKFLVQSVAVTPDKEFASITSIWENADKTELREKKIRVTFLPAVDGTPGLVTPQKSGLNGYGEDTPGTNPPAYSSPSPEESAYTPAQRSSATTGATTSHEDGDAETEPTRDTPVNTATTTIKETATSAAAAVSNAMPASVDELKAQLAQAQATIASYGKEGGLRMRKAAGASGGNSASIDTASVQQAAQGVPMQIVAALCLVSFLLAYFLF